MPPEHILIRDLRTERKYRIPIYRNNAVRAVDFKQIIGSDGGLRVHDPGLQNTSVVETGISYSYLHHSLSLRLWARLMFLK